VLGQGLVGRGETSGPMRFGIAMAAGTDASSQPESFQQDSSGSIRKVCARAMMAHSLGGYSATCACMGTILTRLTACQLHLARLRKWQALPAKTVRDCPVTFSSSRKTDQTTPHATTKLRTMSAIGSLIFCIDCGNLLDGSAGKKNVTLTCAICGATCKGMSWHAHSSHSTSISLTLTRHVFQDGRHALQTHSVPVGFARKAIRSPDHQRRRCADKCCYSAPVRKVWSRRGSLLHSATAQCRRGHHCLLRVRVWSQVCCATAKLACGTSANNILQVEYEQLRTWSKFCPNL
jgi:hypothetical protein